MSAVPSVQNRMSRVGRRRVLILSAATAASALFALVSYTPLHFAVVSPVQAGVLVVASVVAALGTLGRLKVLLPIVGVIMISFGILRFVSFGQSWSFLNGGLSGGALVVGLGMGFLALAMSDSRPPGAVK